MQILKEGGLPPTVYRIPEVSLADVLKKEKIEEDIDFLFTEANLYHDYKCVLRFYLEEETYEKKKRGGLRFEEVSPDTYEHLRREGNVPLNLFAFEDQISSVWNNIEHISISSKKDRYISRYMSRL